MDDDFGMTDDERRFIVRAHEMHSRSMSCIECGKTGTSERGWQAHLTDDDPPEVLVYCPNCAEREFGSAS